MPGRPCCRLSRTAATSKKSKTTRWSSRSAGRGTGILGRFFSNINHIARLTLWMNPRSRSKDIVEPLLKPQWYVSCTDMGRQAADAVREGRLKIIPDHHLKTWFNWMDNIRWLKRVFNESTSCSRWRFISGIIGVIMACLCSSLPQGLVYFAAAVVGPPYSRLLHHCQRRLCEAGRSKPRSPLPKSGGVSVRYSAFLFWL